MSQFGVLSRRPKGLLKLQTLETKHPAKLELEEDRSPTQESDSGYRPPSPPRQCGRWTEWKNCQMPIPRDDVGPNHRFLTSIAPQHLHPPLRIAVHRRSAGVQGRRGARRLLRQALSPVLDAARREAAEVAALMQRVAKPAQPGDEAAAAARSNARRLAVEDAVHQLMSYNPAAMTSQSQALHQGLLASRSL